ncbi:hypothetical protein V1521DRAFT_420848, partial [Lipomyces starkeyi]
MLAPVSVPVSVLIFHGVTAAQHHRREICSFLLAPPHNPMGWGLRFYTCGCVVPSWLKLPSRSIKVSTFLVIRPSANVCSRLPANWFRSCTVKFAEEI